MAKLMTLPADNLAFKLWSGSQETVSDDANLAFGKNAKQSDIYNDNHLYKPKAAVDGNIENFSHTSLSFNKWWMVDLGQQYEVTNVELYNRRGSESSRLQKVYILTSNYSSPSDPDLNSGKWTVRYYHHPPYGAIGNIILEGGVFVRHVAVFSTHNEGVTLAEVKVYAYNKRFTQITLLSSAKQTPATIPKEWSNITTFPGTGKYNPVAVLNIDPNKPLRHLAVTTDQQDHTITLKEVQVFEYSRHNHALNKATAQADTYNNEIKYRSSSAVDGLKDTFSNTKEASNRWWKLDLGKNIIFQYAKIYVRSGRECGEECGKAGSMVDYSFQRRLGSRMSDQLNPEMVLSDPILYSADLLPYHFSILRAGPPSSG
ncbi:uncharacterized protein [Watersipora subatra]|uniref:uncharacterized protein n=1 Tax=Watersipora subatra TaxID=2589382 RepID=UPI00355C1D8B